MIDFDLHFGNAPQHDRGNQIKIAIRGVSLWYGGKQALHDITLDIYQREVVAFIGPSGCGKTTLLRCLNRTNELIPGVRQTGQIILDNVDIQDPALELPHLRRRFGWVAQRPNPFPFSIFHNVAYGPRLHGLVSSRSATRDLVERTLIEAGLWDEVKDRLDEPGTDLSGGQQQRLCIARAIAYQPDVLLMDEPASALDPTATAKLEELIERLRADYAIVIITHNMQQAARISQRVAMFHLGRLVEQGDASDIFVAPHHPLTRDYVTGRFG